MANVSGVTNAVQIESSLAGPVMITGAGAGGEPTASAVLADIIDFANQAKSYPFGRKSVDIEDNFKSIGYRDNLKFYLRFTVLDKSGVLADLTSIFKNYDLSIESFIQKLNPSDKTADLIIVTHEANKLVLDKALNSIENIEGIIKEPVCLSIYL